MLRRVLIPSGPLLSAVAIVKSDQSADSKKEKSLICKPSALPIYSSLVDRWLSRKHRQHKISDILRFSSSGCKVHANRKPSKVAETIEDGVRVVRHEVSKVTDFYDSQKATVDRYYVDAMKETQRKLKFEEIFR